MIEWLKTFLRHKLVYPQPAEMFFVDGLCPNCGSPHWTEESKFDGCEFDIECGDCGARFAVTIGDEPHHIIPLD